LIAPSRDSIEPKPICAFCGARGETYVASEDGATFICRSCVVRFYWFVILKEAA
jgi:hypothetical protein